jgi:hypothetical protein
MIMRVWFMAMDWLKIFWRVGERDGMIDIKDYVLVFYDQLIKRLIECYVY